MPSGATSDGALASSDPDPTESGTVEAVSPPLFALLMPSEFGGGQWITIGGSHHNGPERTVDTMPTVLSEVNVTSLRDYTEQLETRMNTSGKGQWYRGCGSAAHRLTPTLYRHPAKTGFDTLLETERNLLTGFRHRSLPYLVTQPDTDLEWLFLMQHHGVPTRLLDWTENPYVALFFALSSAQIIGRTGAGVPEFGEACAVWLLNPTIWNQRALHLVTFNEGVLSAGDDLLKGYAPRTDPRIMNSDPVAIYGVHNSRRIVAQRGVFVVFGKDIRPMETIFSENDYPAEALTKVVIPPDRIGGLLGTLTSIGVTDSAIYPDLDGLARELKRSAGFYV